MADPAGRFSIAFDELEGWQWDPTWTSLDVEYPNLVTSYSIDRGRQYELDRTDTGRATVEIIDPDGILDPANPTGPFAFKLEPLLQAAISRYDPVADAWRVRYRGFVEDWSYVVDPSQRLSRLTITLVDLFEILSSVELYPGRFGDTPPAGYGTNIYLQRGQVNERIIGLLQNMDLPTEFYVIFSGNVLLWDTVYSGGETLLTALQEAADSEFPGVANLYCDRKGRVVFHGRIARFDPSLVLAEDGVYPDKWEWTEWRVGDGGTDPDTYVPIRRFSYNRGLSKIINFAQAYPNRPPGAPQLKESELRGQIVEDTGSRGQYGYRSWSAQNLQTHTGLLLTPHTTDLQETKLFAQYYVDNFALPLNRVTEITFRSLDPTAARAAQNWDLLSRLDISDRVIVKITDNPGDSEWVDVPHFVEGIHEQVRPLNPVFDDVTMSLDLSPEAYYDTNPWG